MPQLTLFVVVINALFALGIAIQFLYFVWALTFYIWEMGSEEGKREYKIMILDTTTRFLVLIIAFSLVYSIEQYFGIAQFVQLTH